MGNIMKALGLSRRWWAAALVGVVALALSAPAGAQNGFTAKIGLDTLALPVGFTGIFQLNSPVPVAFRLDGPTSDTFQGFKDREFFLLFRLTDSAGNVTALDTQHWDFQTFTCSVLTVGGQLQLLPTAVLVTLAETDTFPIGETIPDITTIFPVLAQPGSYLLQAVVPMKTWNPSVPNQVFTNCSGLPPGTFVNVGPGGGTDFTVFSNGLLVTRCCFTYVWGPPLDPNLITNVKSGRTVPVKFQLRQPDGTPVSTATARLFVEQGGVVRDLGPFRFDPNIGNYIVNWDTTGFALGEWRVRVHVDDGSADHVAFVNIQP